MARKEEAKPQELDFTKELNELYKGTTAKLVSESTVMHNRQKVPTPLIALNCILGGGIPLGCIVEAYGAPTSGKSSSMYQTMGMFQKMYPHGIPIIVDTEASVDGARMPFMGCDPNKVLRIPSTTIEDGFDQIYAILDKKGKNPKIKDLPVFILWDTIGTNASEKEFESKSQYGEGMMGNAKLLKNKLKMLLPYIEDQPVLVVLLNQVTTEKTMYGAKLSSGGGWAIKHNAHLRLYFESGKTEFDGVFATYKSSTVDIEKSKLSPLFYNLNIIIDISKGGVVDSELSFLDYARTQLGLINSGSWCNMDPIVQRYPEYVGHFEKFVDPNGSFRTAELDEYIKRRPKLLKVLELAFLDMIAERYTYQASICKEYREHVVAAIAAPEPFVRPDGVTVDLWTGEVLSLPPTQMVQPVAPVADATPQPEITEENKGNENIENPGQTEAS